MGIWSEPLFAVCFDANSGVIDPKQVSIDFSGCDERIEELNCHFTKVCEKTNLEDFFASVCDTARIYGYINFRKCIAWTECFRLIFDQNPAVDEIQLHFWCRDEHFPYFVGMYRHESGVSIHRAESGNVMYSDVRDLTLEEQEESERWEKFKIDFNKDKYKSFAENHPKRFSEYTRPIVLHIYKSEWVEFTPVPIKTK